MKFILVLCLVLNLIANSPVYGQAITTISRYVTTGADDAEESVSGGVVDLISADLELVADSSKNQVVGIRFTTISIPRGSKILNAFIQFTTRGDKNPIFGDVIIKGENVDNSLVFTTGNANISSRLQTTDSVTWMGSTNASWGAGAAGSRTAEQRTPELAKLVETIISRAGWLSGNALSFVLFGNGVRNAWSYNGNLNYSPELIIQYIPPSIPPVANFPLAKNSDWFYLDNGTNQGKAWKLTIYNDSAWNFGKGSFGYGINVNTQLYSGPDPSNRFITSYFRKKINIPSVGALKDTLLLNLLADDGAIVYVNGGEVLRINMPGGSIDNTTLATKSLDPSDDATYFPYLLPKSVLIDGENTIAVEVHQAAKNSTDLAFDLELKELPLPTLIRGPYLQVATNESMIIRWRTDVPTNSRVKIGSSANSLNTVFNDSAFVTDHIIKVTALQPGTRYYYSIGNFYQTDQGDSTNYFETLPEAGSTQLLRIGVFGDCGTNAPNQINVKNQFLNYLGQDYLNSWLLLGDNAYETGTDAEFQLKFFDIYKDNLLKKYPLWPTPGNHDYGNGTTNGPVTHDIAYYKNFSMPVNGEAGGEPSGREEYYSFDIGNTHFLSLDSYGRDNTGFRLYDTLSPQVLWVKRDLQANQNKGWVVAYWHHPPYTMGNHNSDTEVELIKIRENFTRILERNGVDLILCGHSHDYERSKLMKGSYGNEASFNPLVHNLSMSSGRYDTSANACPYVKQVASNYTGSVYVVAGSAGKVGGQQAGYPHNAMHYSNSIIGGAMMLEVQDNRLDVKWICSDGIIRDRFTMMKDVSKKKFIRIPVGDSVTLTASYIGNYFWTPVSNTTRSVNIRPVTSRDTFYVADNQNCISDTFIVEVKNTAITDYFRTKAPGNWNDTATWQSSPDSITWQRANLTPDFRANTISLSHSVTVTHDLTIDQVTVNNHALLTVGPTGALTINDGEGADLFLKNGGFGSRKNSPAKTKKLK